MSIFSGYWTESVFVTGLIIAFYTLFTLLTISIFATAMLLCWKKVAATQFTIYMAVSNLGLSLGASLLGPLKSLLDYDILILTCVLSSGIMLFLLQFINLEKHLSDIDELEKNGGNNFKTVFRRIKLSLLKKY